MDERRYWPVQRSFEAEVTPPNSGDVAYWFIFQGRRLLVAHEEDAFSIPRTSRAADLGIAVLRQQYLGRLDGIPCFSAELADEAEAPWGMSLHSLRRLYNRLDEELFWVAGLAIQIVDWDRTHQFCGVCGSPTDDSSGERVKVCRACKHTHYPRLAPAIIVAVLRDDRILLARSHRHPPGMFSVLAGFVEPGETLESCLVREVREEVGIEVKDIRYFGSQPWPFPHSLMIAFTCHYARGELTLDETEIAEASWYRADQLPQIPPSISIARRLIDWFAEGYVG